MRVPGHVITVIVTTENGRSVLCTHKQDRAGQWVNAFSMAMRLTLGRDEVERLTTGPKVRKPQSSACSQAPIQLDILRGDPLNPHITRHAVGNTSCYEEQQRERGRRRWRGSSADRMCSNPKTFFHSHLLIHGSWFVINHTKYFLCSFKTISPLMSMS